MKILIVEDEMLAAERLKLMIGQYDPTITDIHCTESIQETVAWLQTQPPPDLVLSDIELGDGQSLDLFRDKWYRGPVVFTTAYDQYAIDAFRHFSIDYILKPVTAEALAAAMEKYRQMRVEPATTASTSFKSRFLGRIGQRLQFIRTDNISFFQADNKVVYLCDQQGSRYLVDFTLEKLEQLLNPSQFFRLNRRYIVHFSAIEYIKPYLNSRLKLAVRGASPQDEFIISRDRVAEFKHWADC